MLKRFKNEMTPQKQTELKTLKDLKDKLANHIIEQREFIPEADFVSVKELKAEAVKWVKNYGDIMAMQPFKRFFNLTEEDLK